MVTQREILDSYNRLSSRIVRGAGTKLAGVFTNLGSWRDADFDRFLILANTTLSGASMQAARLQVAFYQQMATAAGQSFVAPELTRSNFTTQALRNGAPAGEVYRRPFVNLYTALSEGKTMTEAVESGARRISSIASTDVQLARRNAGFASRGRNSGIVGYARTLTGAENCALCFVASTQRYKTDELMAIHPGCDCGEMPIYGNQDPGQVINEVRLDASHQAIEDRFGLSDAGGRDIGLGKTYTRKDGTVVQADYTAIKIRQHGELGPLLTIADQNFTGPNDF